MTQWLCLVDRGGGMGVGAELGAGLRKIDSVLERTRLVTYALFYFIRCKWAVGGFLKFRTLMIRPTPSLESGAEDCVVRWLLTFSWNYTIACWNIQKLILLFPNTLSVSAINVLNLAELFWFPSTNFTEHVFWFSTTVSISIPSSDEDEAGE